MGALWKYFSLLLRVGIRPTPMLVPLVSIFIERGMACNETRYVIGLDFVYMPRTSEWHMERDKRLSRFVFSITCVFSMGRGSSTPRLHQ
jgi:hypothetical protein